MTLWLWRTIISILGLAKIALADGGPIGTGGITSITLPNPLSCRDIPCIAKAIIGALFAISIPIVSIMVLIGGFQIMTAGGDPEKFTTGRKTILYAVVGFAVILLANGVVYLVQNLLK